MGEALPWRCYACTDPSSTAPLATYCSHPDTRAILFHPACFVTFAGWLETRSTLGVILSTWTRVARCRRRYRRIQRVLYMVRRWQRSNWTEWARNMHARSCCRRVLYVWRRELPPPLVDSSSEEVDGSLSEQSELSSGSTTGYPGMFMAAVRDRFPPRTRPAEAWSGQGSAIAQLLPQLDTGELIGRLTHIDLAVR